MNVNPCYKCNKRNVNCHSTCKAYTDWKAEYNRIKEEIKLERSINIISYDRVRRYNERVAYRNKNHKLYG